MFALIAVFIPIIIFVKKRYELENNFIFIFSTAMCLYFVSQRMIWSNQIHYLLPFLMLAKLATGENLKKTFFFYLIYLILLIPYDMGYFFNENITFVMVPVIGIYTLLIMIDLLYSYKKEKTNFT